MQVKLMEIGGEYAFVESTSRYSSRLPRRVKLVGFGEQRTFRWKPGKGDELVMVKVPKVEFLDEPTRLSSYHRTGTAFQVRSQQLVAPWGPEHQQLWDEAHASLRERAEVQEKLEARLAGIGLPITRDDVDVTTYSRGGCKISLSDEAAQAILDLAERAIEGASSVELHYKL